MARPYTHNIEDRKNICLEYLKGVSTTDLANAYGCSTCCIRKTLNDHNIPIRSRKESKQLDNFKDKIRGENNRCWKGGTTKIKNRIRMLSEYAIWRTEVYKRDNYTCCNCGNRGSKGNKVVLNCDHIIPLSQLVEDYKITNTEEAISCSDLWDISNGSTLCYDCHLKTETYGFNYEHHKRKVVQLSLNGDEINRFNSIIECSNLLNIHRSSINRVCSGVYKSAKGFKFKYENN